MDPDPGVRPDRELTLREYQIRIRSFDKSDPIPKKNLPIKIIKPQFYRER